MRLLYNLAIYFYVTLLSIIGILMIGFTLDFVQVSDISAILENIYTSYQINLFFTTVSLSRVIFALTGLLIIILAFSFAQVLTGKIQEKKTIAFNNPSGRVTISLSAIEDLIKRLTIKMPEIKECRSDVVATRKGGLEVELRTVLRSDIDIPGMINNLQDVIKTKLQEALGLEETISVKVHVAKIVSQDTAGCEAARKEKKERNAELKNPSIPFQGYGR
ncbi:MAG: hypothetical protein COV72_00145 [Candidatus Omnitrophica bacterium CG11_big_fil_rev_8_21_14_0_20_42_13]|uniref:Alkaline shock response membrane anchor protein AmaP n=1 Tax=Candidatus Ghiorseimicrobium undicola TaxID=1974746 RepID=A0A2H0LZZ2_9BACT|nr:MAG: hypothetical protein COV72_00145 [Candidatus Omnitrophica bacterium CG11_big_fil_rev_8_21_14_0_20_42_13]